MKEQRKDKLILKDIIIKIVINNDKNYLNELLNHKLVIKVINDIVKWYKFNKEDVKNVSKMLIIEYITKDYSYNDNSDFNSIDFLKELYRVVSSRTKTLVCNTYKNKEIPFDNLDIVNKDIDYSLIDLEEQIDLLSALNVLDYQEKMVIYLYYYEELNQDEIAYRLNIGQPRVSTIHKQSLKKMKKFLK